MKFATFVKMNYATLFYSEFRETFCTASVALQNIAL